MGCLPHNKGFKCEFHNKEKFVENIFVEFKRENHKNKMSTKS